MMIDDLELDGHTYVECCDRIPLIGNTVRHNDHGVMVRVCADGYGCDAQ